VCAQDLYIHSVTFGSGEMTSMLLPQSIHSEIRISQIHINWRVELKKSQGDGRFSTSGGGRGAWDGLDDGATREIDSSTRAVRRRRAQRDGDHVRTGGCRIGGDIAEELLHILLVGGLGDCEDEHFIHTGALEIRKYFLDVDGHRMLNEQLLACKESAQAIVYVRMAQFGQFMPVRFEEKLHGSRDETTEICMQPVERHLMKCYVRKRSRFLGTARPSTFPASTIFTMRANTGIQNCMTHWQQ
jgi:hypothetical protein